MLAELKISTGDEETDIQVSVDDLMAAINTAGVKFGIDTDILQSISSEHKFNDWIAFAHGQQPVDGEDGDIMFDFSTEGSSVHLKEDAAGRVNIKDLNLIQNVKTGDVLCFLAPPKPGRDGTSVKGDTIAATQGAPALLPGGENVKVSDDGQSLLAAIDGMVSWDGTRVSVSNVYTIDRVDANTGNIRFNGTVIVNGEVGDGFEIHAGGDVRVAMSVGRVVINAGGDIHIGGGILGQEKATLCAGKSLHAKFMQDVDSVEAIDSVVIDDYILNSRVSCNGPVVIKGSNGFIAGSTISSETWIYSHTVGIDGSSADTTLIIGQDPEIIQRKYELADAIYEKVKDFLKLKLSLNKLREIKKKGKLSDAQKELYSKILSAIETVRYNLEQHELEISSISQKLDTTYNGNIYVEDTIFEGSKVMFGNCKREIHKSRAVTQFCLDGEEIIEKTFSLKPEIKSYLEDSDG